MVTAAVLVVSVPATALGLLLYRYAHTVTSLGEALDAIGSTRDAAGVEPADWNVQLTRYAGVAVALAGLYFTVGALLGW